jgi:hypothetical protein
MPGRAARMTKLPGWNPAVYSSMSRKARREAGAVAAAVVEPIDLLEGALEQLVDRRELAALLAAPTS